MNRTEFLKKLDALVGPFCARMLFARNKEGRIDITQVRRVLFIRPGGIGDAVLLVPVINAFCAQYPQVSVDVLAEKRNVGVFELCPQAQQVFCYDCLRDWPRFFSPHYDLIIDTEQWHYLSAVIARLLRAPVSCGFATNSRKKLFTHTVPYSHHSYEVDSFLSLLNGVGQQKLFSPYSQFLTLRDDLAVRRDALLHQIDGRPYAVLFPGASIMERRWGCASFRNLAQSFFDKGISIVVVGGTMDAELGRQIVADLDFPYGVNLTGETTLGETAAILKKATVLVSADSGVLHLAAGVGCPSVALFGPGIVEKWAPQGSQHSVVSLDLSCSPCTRFGTTPKCKKLGQCIQEITVEMVWAKVEPLLPERFKNE